VARQAKPTVYRIDPLAEAVDPVDDALVNPRTAYRPQARVFQTAPFETAVMYSGRFAADLAIAMDTRDADIGIWVYGISPDGATVQLGFDVIRARFRNGPEQLLTPGQVERYRSVRAFWNSTRLEKGSRIRLVVAPLEDLDWHRNFNSGGDLVHETAKDAKVATVSIHHDLRAPSTIDLPVKPID
jgi:predicted acyl esterase